MDLTWNVCNGVHLSRHIGLPVGLLSANKRGCIAALLRLWLRHPQEKGSPVFQQTLSLPLWCFPALRYHRKDTRYSNYCLHALSMMYSAKCAISFSHHAASVAHACSRSLDGYAVALVWSCRRSVLYHMPRAVHDLLSTKDAVRSPCLDH